MIMKQKVIALIPARYDSTRLPVKPLCDICGRPMILRVVERACSISCIDEVVVATDHEEIAKCVEREGAKAIITSKCHPSGTDRIAEAAEKLGLTGNDIVVNIQGDQPLIEAEPVRAMVEVLKDTSTIKMSTVACPMSSKDALNPNRVKVVLDSFNNAVYFSRSVIPYDRDGQLSGNETPYLRHLGLYAYQKDFLEKFIKMPMGRLEKIEKLEQLRVLEHGFKIKVAVVKTASPEVDTMEDLELVRSLYEKLNHV